MMSKRFYKWPDGKHLEIGSRTLIMGILNVTPDSFSDGGKWNTLDNALQHMREMAAAGADIIDIGAESSRPGFVPMSADEEIERLELFLEPLLEACPVPVSIDTFKAATAEYAASKGVHILNDIWGLQYEAEPGKMAQVAAKYGLPVVVMHNRRSSEYAGDIMEAMADFFRDSIKIAKQAGVEEGKIILDPGIGFGKTVDGNLYVMNHLEKIKYIDGKDYPLLLGTSRKSFIGQTLALPVEERMEATGATCVMGIMKGCEIMRVHDVLPISRMCRMTDAVLEARV
ncbi:dihydropteroate synthase [uncultured Anaerovibrio sp.]|uniref:dihydropteroate synthase n=1 Tax=uncultured Anaerovibrio sp. TaxID=361586 RepID=UPI002624CCB4|nr:dihydropteroate synthase [uncultured Anaerovibrio sp.]